MERESYKIQEAKEACKAQKVVRAMGPLPRMTHAIKNGCREKNSSIELSVGGSGSPRNKTYEPSTLLEWVFSDAAACMPPVPFK